ncbi:MAG: LamG domain-containing protein [Proteobacteria bacterium]|nr:LamG domain-containing protein [Pseudomonadota bacterium]
MYNSLVKSAFFGAAAIIAVAIVTPATATTVGYWNFEEGSAGNPLSGAGSVLDQSGFGNHGSPTGNPAYSGDIPANPVPLTGAPNGVSLSLDGSGDHVSITADNTTNLNLTTAFTVEFWMKTANSTPSGQKLLVDKSHGFVDSTGWALQMLSGGRVAFNLGAGGGGASNFPGITSSTSVLDAEWHHIAGTFDSGSNEISLYIDGALEGTVITSGYVTNTRDINIGAACVFVGCNFSNKRFFNGGIDELRISDTALSSDQFLNASTAVHAPGGMGLSVVGLAAFAALRRRKSLRAA